MENNLNPIWLIFGWIAFYFFHSLLATLKVKSLFRKRAVSYRLFYTLFSTTFLGVLIIYGFQFDNKLFESIYIQGLGVLVGLLGLIIILKAFKPYDTSGFLGLKKEDYSGIIQTGLQGFVRHPLYLGTLLFILGIFLLFSTMGSFILFAVLVLYLPFGIYLEEQKLMKEFGEEYGTYKKNIPSLFPKLKDCKRFLQGLK